ncbi:gamma-glutamylcyclotransferase family protein [Deinococcus aestuarii]|uniref:gamma-glutamylcyclotransferase family protein n=1 Tax=Deinococcus aestuarii TaxID=2774531 RepID=UPI001C0DEBFB|nr:gamma-glutamylcyclotransferase family protein [Deinococcus aestuarii]
MARVPEQPLTRVFVYGTLMPGERNAHVAAQGGTFEARPARLPGFRLLHLLPEAYPAVVPGGAGEKVCGQVLTYAREDWGVALPFLDALEGVDEVPPLYTREEVTVTLEGEETCAAWVYVYANAARLARPGVVPIPDGDWRGAPDRARPRPEDR